MAEVMATKIESAFTVRCPLCNEEIPIDIHVAMSPDEWWPTQIILSTAPDTSPIWNHVMIHQVEKAVSNDSANQPEQ